MFRRGFFYVILLLFVANAVCASTSATDELSTLLSAYKTYQADFTQVTYMDEQGGAAEKSSGRVMMMRPGKFRWEINQPTKQIIIANGNALWIYDVDLQQATRRMMSAQGGTNPAALLTGDVSKLIKQFTIKIIKRRGLTWYQLTPASANNRFTLVQMHFSKGELAAVWVKNNLGQSSRFHFYNIQLNAALKKKLFIFKAPSGVDILKQ